MIPGHMPAVSEDAAPHLAIEPAGVTPAANGLLLCVAWRVVNLTDGPIEILESWLPHGRFFGARQPYEPALLLPAHGSTVIRRDVRYADGPGEVVENAFLNLVVGHRQQQWRVLTRLRVERVSDEVVDLAVQAVTAQRVGFAQAAAENGRGGETGPERQG